MRALPTLRPICHHAVVSTHLLQPRRPPFVESLAHDDVKAQLQSLDSDLTFLSSQWEAPDTRHVAFSNAHIVTVAVGEFYNALGAPADEATFRALFGAEGGTPDDLGRHLDWLLKMSLVTFIQFQLENMLSNLLRAAQVNPATGHASLVRQALTHFGYPHVETGLKILRVPAAMRNSLHNNGFHTSASFDAQINGVRFRFNQHRRVHQASWDHITHAIRAELRVYERLLHMASVRAIGLVPDRFAEVVLRQ